MKLISIKSSFILIAVVNVFLITCSMLSIYYPTSLISKYFNLGVENNLSVLWSSWCLFSAAFVFILVALYDKKIQLGSVSIAILLFFLSLDESGSLHERIYQNNWRNYILPAAMCATCFLYGICSIFRKYGKQTELLVLVLGFTGLGTVVIQEILEHFLVLSLFWQAVRVGAEEGIELFSSLLILYTAVNILKIEISISQTKFNFLKFRDENILQAILIVSISLLGVHLGFSIISPSLSGYPGRGNPAMWYPMCMNMLVASWILLNSSTIRNWVFLLIPTMLGAFKCALFLYTVHDILKLVFVETALILLMFLIIFYKSNRIFIPSDSVPFLLLLPLLIVSSSSVYVESAIGLYLLSAAIPISTFYWIINRQHAVSKRYN